MELADRQVGQSAVFLTTHLVAGCGSYRQTGRAGCSPSNSTAENGECHYLTPAHNHTGTDRCVQNKESTLEGSCARVFNPFPVLVTSYEVYGKVFPIYHKDGIGCPANANCTPMPVNADCPPMHVHEKPNSTK